MALYPFCRGSNHKDSFEKYPSQLKPTVLVFFYIIANIHQAAGCSFTAFHYRCTALKSTGVLYGVPQSRPVKEGTKQHRPQQQYCLNISPKSQSVPVCKARTDTCALQLCFLHRHYHSDKANYHTANTQACTQSLSAVLKHSYEPPSNYPTLVKEIICLD